MISFGISATFFCILNEQKGFRERSRGIEMKLYRTVSPAGPIAKNSGPNTQKRGVDDLAVIKTCS